MISLLGAPGVEADAIVGVGDGADDAPVPLTGQAPLTGTPVVDPIEGLWGALAVLHGLVCATGNAQDGVMLAASALTLHTVQTDLTVLQVDNKTPGSGSCIGHCKEGHKQKNKDLLLFFFFINTVFICLLSVKP